jgi:RNA polymerase sigma factor (sigma-70 family)
MSALAVATGPADRETDDLDLVAAVRAGDDRAFEVLFLRYQPRIAAYVGGMVRDHGRAEDITQEVFMSALRRLRADDEREILFRPWIYEIAKNKCIDAYRRGRNMDEVSLDAHDESGVAEHGRLAEPRATPDAAVEGKLAFDNLRGAFGGLSPVHHDILVMREFEGLSYREIGERLGMTRPAVESTLFRARKRLGEEYDELVSGKRCLRVQRIVEEGVVRVAGVRDQRRVARHLAHCQPCRRHAHRTGVDLDLLRPVPSRAARVAALLPLPAFVRRRWGGGEDAAPFLSVQASRPAAQMTAHLAGTVDPGTASGWAKLAATAATVALAGVGGATIEHRATVRPAAAGAASGPAAEQARSKGPDRPRRVVMGARLPAQAAATGERAGAGTPASAATSATTTPPATASGSPQATGGSPSRSAVDLPAVDPQGAVQVAPQAPLGSVDDAAGGTLTPLLDTVGGAGREAGTSLGTGSGDEAGTAGLNPGRVVGGAVAPVTGATHSAGGLSTVGDVARGADGALGGASDALRAPAGTAANAAPTGQGASLLPSVSDTLRNPTAAPPSLGG